ncbi:hypothetical protein CspeluHIS016_0305170 [Cutaneotrichosporon spelunceum]|uniref:G-patch domain-containing protein n=1 Tax=Cutaneotrichosporon spelunceum TaxID=1672016 RepID=A0AAD3YC78_9TREE|nr:hypothetical protein CspeluHIS016_0305170 [Cutaneotrichosporon spelunceum]
MDHDPDAPSGPPRRGLGFLAPPAYIRSHTPQGHDSAPRDRAAWKDWNINPAGHGGWRAPPVFVLAENSYDDLGRSLADGFGVDVEGDDKDEERVGEDGAAVADWYRSLSAKASGASSRAPSPAPAEQASKPVASASFEAMTAPPLSDRPKIRVHRSEWFIRRALASAAKNAGPAPQAGPSSISSMLNIDSAQRAPPPIPRYALGPENAGFSRLAALGWGGGGLGRPVGWTDADARGARKAGDPRPCSREPGVVDLTADSDSDSGDDDTKHGPGRTAPIATALKFNRLGLGRVPADKRVSHSHAEIERARMRATGQHRKAESNKAKVKWAVRERREREQRARIAAALRD